ncbi:bifunctional diguanylate cyclase/phosphodiesterase [Pseudoduganella namucuonensis]|uniref:PAS domain S-box-containing protein/diguanylate cyclase (GGDEF) domain-containing protein n=1 Tax=Pseudoduganella namucuonensis TaxID=1035707 RepID=A0A1I7LWY1_9BURK|nr:EAL domain-containing protein [Pseudoduganella namucuonensis]SFV14169.1 PAS domain S-box-containing protein/diguanylate cyclase (GGDEF) domain-containing protein [Pseudoduganella namucuonensis]
MTTRRPSKLALAAACTLGAGLAVTALLFSAVGRLEHSAARLAFEQRADQRTAALQSGLDDAVEVLAVTSQLFQTVAPVTRGQFHDFTRPLLARHPFIQAFNYHRMLAHAERGPYEARMRREFPGFQIMGIEDGRLAPAPDKPWYNVVDYLEPLAGNERAFGLDASYHPQIRQAIESMLADGRPAATGLIKLAQSIGNESGMVMLMPVYRPGMPTATSAQRHAAWLGDVATVIRATTLVRKILEGDGLLRDPQLALQVSVGAPGAASSVVFSQGDMAQGTASASATAFARLPGWLEWMDWTHRGEYRRGFTVLGKNWEVRLAALPRPFVEQHLGSLSTLVGGILFSVLMAAFVHTLVLRSRRVQMLVDARTADLQRSNERLNADVASRKRTERALQESEQRFRRLLALSSDWYWEQDVHYCFTSITGGFFDKGHISPERFIGKTRWDNAPEMLTTRWGREHIAKLEARLPFSHLEYAITGDDGVLRWFSTSGEPVYDATGDFRGYRGTGNEITERKLSEQRIQHIAHHDVLTGLPNRVLLQDRLAQAIAYANRSGHPMWVLLIDLDRFKFVNDSLGHKAGDILLKAVAARLQSSVRESDTVARLSGDEFVAILSEYPDAQLSPDIVQRVMNAVAQPVILEGKEFFVTCSIGVAAYDGTVGNQAHHLIEHADIAMYAAKKQGRNGFRFYQPVMNEEALERLRIEGALRKALERGEFVLHYQPQVDLGDGAITGAEALLRWQHPELGVVAPARFIGLAEETGLIVPIGVWALRTACAQARVWHDARVADGQAPLRMAVNLSARQFSQPDLAQCIADVLEETGLPPACLELELTESVFMDDVTQAVGLLHELKALGVTLAIDDFGTGYSSLSYLRSFPIDVLKIDRSFVNDLATDTDDEAIVVSIIALAHNLKLRVVAEGVESREQLEYLRRHDCDQIQGYYFSRPVGPLQFEQMLRDNKHLGRADIAAPARVEAETGT